MASAVVAVARLDVVDGPPVVPMVVAPLPASALEVEVPDVSGPALVDMRVLPNPLSDVTEAVVVAAVV